MAKARRSPSRSGKSRGIVWLVAGLLLGAGLMWTIQHFMYRETKPFRGLAALFAPSKKPAEPEEKKPEVERPAKPKFDFYTILPEFETVLPEPKSNKKTAKAEPPEAGVNYILQAASLANLEDADRLKAKLVLNGLDARIEKISIQGKGDYYRVRIGPYAKLEELDTASAKLAQLGIKALRIKVKKGTG